MTNRYMYPSNALWMVPVNEKTLNLALQRQLSLNINRMIKTFLHFRKKEKEEFSKICEKYSQVQKT